MLVTSIPPMEDYLKHHQRDLNTIYRVGPQVPTHSSYTNNNEHNARRTMHNAQSNRHAPSNYFVLGNVHAQREDREAL
jgi:hypothetical protein